MSEQAADMDAPATPTASKPVFLPSTGASPAIKPIPLNSPSTFKPSMESSAHIRAKVRSSGYGKEVATSKVSERTAKSKDEKELEQLGADAFKPKLVSTPEGRRIRSSAPSSGYGKGVAVVKKKRAPTTPTFQPDPSITAKSKKAQVMSSGYGKGIVEKRAPPKPDAPSFTPDMDVSATARRMRKNVISRHAEPRPSTAKKDAERPKTAYTIRHTLAADRDPKDVGSPTAEPVADKPFVIDAEGYSAKGKYFGTKLAWGVAADAEGSMKEMSLKKPITANVASHKYGSEDYTPQVNPRTERSSEPVAFLGGISVSTYVDTPDKLPAAPATKASNAMGQYGEGYQPKVTPKSEVPTAPKNVITTNTPALIPAEVMPPVVHTAYAKKLTERVKGSYTEGVYTPPVVAVASKVEDDLQVEDVAGASYVQAAAKVVDAITTEEAEEDGGADTGDGGDGGDAGAAEELTEL